MLAHLKMLQFFLHWNRRGHLLSKKNVAIFFAFERIFGKNRNIFPEKGAGGGHRPFGNFPKIHPFLKLRASLRSGWKYRSHVFLSISTMNSHQCWRWLSGISKIQFTNKNWKAAVQFNIWSIDPTWWSWCRQKQPVFFFFFKDYELFSIFSTFL